MLPTRPGSIGCTDAGGAAGDTANRILLLILARHDARLTDNAAIGSQKT